MTGVVPEVVAADQLQAANGLLRLGTNGARILGFAVAGVMVKAVGPGWAMMLNALGFAISAGLLACLRLPKSGRIEASNVFADLREGWQEFTSKQWLWVVVLQFSIIVGGLEAFYGVLGPVVAKRDLGGAGGWSVVLAGESIGMFLGVGDRDPDPAQASDAAGHVPDVPAGGRAGAARAARAALRRRGRRARRRPLHRHLRRAVGDVDAA